MTAPVLVIITGHSKGLGKALAEHYLQQSHCAVWGISRQKWPISSAQLHQTALDLADSGQLMAFLKTKAWQRSIQSATSVVLINNAGSVVPNAILGQQDDMAISQAVALNVTAPLLLSNALMALMKPTQDFRIAHISSGAARKTYPGWSVYGSTKAALDQHAAVVAAEGHIGVRIASIAPGVVDTGMQETIRDSDHTSFPLRQQFVDLHHHGLLQSSEATAKWIAAMIEDDRYGQIVLRDVRESQ
ncbi:SDR family NAD(P)-dependent oxidoreductase [Snodgrassella sp. CFCC 13594]|uniref:SDR family NAD(P)-dependent oxidoreductase n=1 Tax=Snodgrassella sp. CFCC 13594 TaxID=1775559 RepID=UPI00083327E6|nr:SDR family NAD(P)-dependent oxidoreductase [Snodgrassella sp. CFCC 13594]